MAIDRQKPNTEALNVKTVIVTCAATDWSFTIT